MKCTEVACIAQYYELERAAPYTGDELAHCEERDCHEIYLCDLGGGCCAQCFKAVCPRCLMDACKGCLLGDDSGEWYCAQCRDRLLQCGELTRCQNPYTPCERYASTLDPQCQRCPLATCDACWSQCFLETTPLCRGCRARDV